MKRGFVLACGGFALALTGTMAGAALSLAGLDQASAKAMAAEPAQLTSLPIPKTIRSDLERIGPYLVVDRSGTPVQCAIYARRRTGLALSGRAADWWTQAEGVYRRSHEPEAGAVFIMGGTARGHIAVVAEVLNRREILVDHANWLGAGEVVRGALVKDVSEANDWSAVRVWHPPTNSLGMRTYSGVGFIHPNDDA
ncbi:MAG: CHAP domain-containing protein [Terricaulis sp.]